MSVAEVESYLYVSECGVAAAMTLLVFDCCLTFGSEVDWLFGTRWTLARIHFTTSRYLPFVVLSLSIPASRVLPPSRTDYCGPLRMTTDVIFYLCIVLAEAMFAVRTYVFWKRDKRILVGMCIFGLVCLVAAIVPSETIGSQPTNSVYKALHCAGVQSTVAITIQYTSLILYEAGMLGLNWIAFRRMKKHNHPGKLIATLYRDGMIYMTTILLFSVMNAIMSALYSDILNIPQLVIHSILASRIFFNLRETSQQEQESPLSMSLSTFHAAPQTADIFNNSMGSSHSGGRIHVEVTKESVVHAEGSSA